MKVWTTHQINEAFASQFAYCVEQLKIPINKINPKLLATLSIPSPPFIMCPSSGGGSVALTHLLGMSMFSNQPRYLLIDWHSKTGARQVVTGLEDSGLHRRNGELLCTSMCVGSGLNFVNERRS